MSPKLGTAIRVFREEGPAGVARVLLGKLTERDIARLPEPETPVWTEYLAWLTCANAGCRPGGTRRLAWTFSAAPSGLAVRSAFVIWMETTGTSARWSGKSRRRGDMNSWRGTPIISFERNRAVEAR